jgi:pimeloyl-ACP methyl ester carboxylesterase
VAVDYARHASMDAALAAIAVHKPQRVIGWSLGGQLAVRAWATGLIWPRQLVLIAPPFQFVATAQPPGMKPDLFAKFRANVARDPNRAMRKGWELIYKDDSRAETVKAHMHAQNMASALARDWLYWLDALQDFTLADTDLTQAPPILLIQGGQDAVVHPDQADYFAAAMPHLRLVRFAHAGHAPHWHDAAAMQALVDGFAHV